MFFASHRNVKGLVIFNYIIIEKVMLSVKSISINNNNNNNKESKKFTHLM